MGSIRIERIFVLKGDDQTPGVISGPVGEILARFDVDYTRYLVLELTGLVHDFFHLLVRGVGIRLEQNDVLNWRGSRNLSRFVASRRKQSNDNSAQ